VDPSTVITAAQQRLDNRPADALDQHRDAYERAVPASAPATPDVSHHGDPLVSPRKMATPTKWADFRTHPLVEDVSDERRDGNGYWVYLRAPFITTTSDSHTIHEETVAEVRKVFREDTAVSVVEAEAMGLDAYKLADAGADAALFHRLGTSILEDRLAEKQAEKPAPKPAPKPVLD